MNTKDNFFIVLGSLHLSVLRKIVEKVERASRIEILKHPRTSLVHAEEVSRFHPFFRSPAIATQCTVAVDGTAGSGFIIGDSWEKAYCFAVIDAALSGNHRVAPEMKKIIAHQASFLAAEFNGISCESLTDRDSAAVSHFWAVS